MGQAIGQELVFAVGVALSPFAIVGVVLMLSTPQARTNGPAFLAGWVAGLAVAGTVFLLISAGTGADEGVGGRRLGRRAEAGPRRRLDRGRGTEAARSLG